MNIGPEVRFRTLEDAMKWINGSADWSLPIEPYTREGHILVVNPEWESARYAQKVIMHPEFTMTIAEKKSK